MIRPRLASLVRRAASLERRAASAALLAGCLSCLLQMAFVAAQTPAALPDPVTVVNGEKISRADFFDVLAKARGGEILDRLIEVKLIEQEMARRRVAVPEEAVDARIRLMSETRVAAGRESFEEALRKEGQSIGPFRRGIRMKIAMETMAKTDYRIPQELGITNLKLERWYKALKDRAEIKGRRDQLPAHVFATVNGEAISADEFNELLWNNTSREERAAALDVLVKRTLLKQVLDKKGLVVGPEDLDAELDRLEKAYGRTAEYKGLSLDAVLQQQGMSKLQLRADPGFAQAVALRKLIRADLTEDQARSFFKEHEFEYSGGQVRVSQIYISAVDTRTGTPKSQKELEEASRKIQDLKRQLSDGADFAALAQQFSEDRASAAEKGDLGFIPRFGKLVETLSAAAFALKKGQVSDPLVTPIGFYLLKVTDVRPGKKTDFEEMKETVYEDLINVQSASWFDKLQKSAQIQRAPF